MTRRLSALFALSFVLLVSLLAALPVEASSHSGTDLQGRWKWGNDGCYWDDWDDGPNQCDPNDPPPPPPGRYKLGPSGCYYDANDSGTDQCSPDVGRWRLNSSGCYWDGGFAGGGNNQCSPDSGRFKLNESGCYWDWSDTGPNQCNLSAGRYKLNATGCYWEPSESGGNECAPSSGRFKLNASGCYWDLYDNGPNQCSPASGRYKLNASGCYWDTGDSGPNQCSPAAGRYKLGPSGCYWDAGDSGPQQCSPAAGRYKLSPSGCFWEPNDSGPQQCNPTVGRMKLGPAGCYYDPNDSRPAQCGVAAGRWKLNSTTCYWDGNDNGPHQCSPLSGRYKGAPEGCYWDWNDSGPNQCVPGAAPPPPPTPLAHILRTRGDHLTIDGVQRFLLFVSYFDALRVPSSGDLDADFHYLRSAGIDGIRIFPNWLHYSCSPAAAGDDSLFALNGTINASAWQAFIRVLDRAAANGLVVDVAFTRETLTGNAADVTSENYLAQIREVAHRLSGGYAHVMFDFQNEHNNDTRLTAAEVAAIAAAVRAEDPLLGPRRVFTVSTGGGFTADAGSIAHSAGLSLAAVHPGRGTDWYTAAAATTTMSETVAAMGSPRVPIYFQEPMPFSPFESCTTSVSDSAAGHARQAAVAAKAAGAAAWTFHTRTTFKMSNGRYRLKLDTLPAERTELEALRSAVDAGGWGLQNFTAPPTPTMTINGVSSGSVNLTVNSTVTVQISNGPGKPGDWVGIFRQGADPRQWLDFRFLNGSQAMPSSGQTSATISFTAYDTGTFEVRFYTDRDFLLLKTSVPINVVDPYPSGRFKWSGTACYWEPNDSGPNQCAPVAPPRPRDTLFSGQVLNTLEYLESSNRRYRFQNQDDGNLVLIRLSPPEVLWDSKKNTPGQLRNQASDGNLLQYSATEAVVWFPTLDDGTEGTAGHPGGVLVMQDDGNLVFIHNGVPIWATHTDEVAPPPIDIPDKPGVETLTYYDTDATGSVRLLTDKNGTRIGSEIYDYTPFGALISTPGSVSVPLDPRQFAGKERDAESGLDYFGGRYLSKDIGRFTAVDPLIDVKANELDPQRWNAYVYVRNNPLRFADPDGRAIFDWQQFKLYLNEVKNFGKDGYGYVVPVVSGVAAVGSLANDILLLTGVGEALQAVRAAGTTAAAEAGTAVASRLGKAGEAAVRATTDIGEKKGIVVAGRTRFPDGLNAVSKVLSEVKNVSYQSFTRQLKDYLAYAQENGLRFDLYVRKGTELSKPLRRAIEDGLINVKYIE